MKDFNVRKLDTFMLPLLEEGEGNRNLSVSTHFPGFYYKSAKLILGLKFLLLSTCLPELSPFNTVSFLHTKSSTKL